MEPAVPSVVLENNELVIRIPIRAEKALNDNGTHRHDAEREAFSKQMNHAMRQLKIQQDLEILACMFHHMPPGETLCFEEQDNYEYTLRLLKFSTGWVFHESISRHQIPQMKADAQAPAPHWFPETLRELDLWEQWDSALSCETRDTLVEHCKGQELSERDLPLLAAMLLDPQWKAKLDAMDLEQSSAPSVNSRSGPRL